jgi:hypothetical protein
VETNLLHMQIPDAKTPCVHAKGNKKQQCVSIPGMLRDLAAGIRMETNVYARKPCRTTAYISRPGEKRGKKDRRPTLLRNAEERRQALEPSLSCLRKPSSHKPLTSKMVSMTFIGDRAWFVSFYSLQILHPYEVHMVV